MRLFFLFKTIKQIMRQIKLKKRRLLRMRLINIIRKRVKIQSLQQINQAAALRGQTIENLFNIISL